MCSKAEKLCMLLSYGDRLDTLNEQVKVLQRAAVLKFASSLKNQHVQIWKNSTSFTDLLIVSFTLKSEVSEFNGDCVGHKCRIGSCICMCRIFLFPDCHINDNYL